jgi:hypothetical protein
MTDERLDHFADGFYYLAGKMTDVPYLNFPRFLEVAEVLRRDRMNIVSPAELDDPEYVELVMNTCISGRMGSGHQKDWRVQLRRDLQIVTHDNCIGLICIPGWETSNGANTEIFVGEKFERELLLFVERPISHYKDKGYELIPFDREEYLIGEELKKIRETGEKSPAPLRNPKDPFGKRKKSSAPDVYIHTGPAPDVKMPTPDGANTILGAQAKLARIRDRKMFGGSD